MISVILEGCFAAGPSYAVFMLIIVLAVSFFLPEVHEKFKQMLAPPPPPFLLCEGMFAGWIVNL